jgi:hypothetical protein
MLFTGLSGQGFQNFLKQIFLKETLNSFSVHFDNASCKLWRSPGCFLVDHKLSLFPPIGTKGISLLFVYHNLVFVGTLPICSVGTN